MRSWKGNCIRAVVRSAKTLVQPDVQVVVNLWKDDPRWRVEAYYHLPIPDGRLRDERRLLDVSRAVAADIRAGACALTMCHAGRNRSGLMSALILRELVNLDGTDAMWLVREARPRAIANPYFEAFLTALAAPRPGPERLVGMITEVPA